MASSRSVRPATHVSPLEFLHPDGVAERCLSIGSNAPTTLRPGLPAASVGAPREAHLPFIEDADLSCPLDFVLLAPTTSECRSPGWLEQAIQTAAGRLAPDGVVYILAAPRWRFKIARLLARNGLVLDVPIAHVPDWSASRYLVPLNLPSVRYAVSELLTLPAWKGWLACSALHLPGAQALFAGLPQTVGLVGRWPGARPLWDWVSRLESEARSHSSVVATISRRGQSRSVVLHCLPGCAHPSAIVKVTLAAGARPEWAGEARLLNRLGPSACRAGATVPQVLREHHLNDYSLLLETAVAGRSAAALLASRPDQLHSIVERLAEWLGRWNSSTVSRERLRRDRLQREIIDPASLLAPHLDQGAEYLAWLAARCATVSGHLVPVVSTHNDLTMSNVLVDEGGHLGIVDWEAAREEGLPLGDFWYAVTDAVAAVDGYQDRFQAFRACFDRDGSHRRAIERHSRRLGIVMKIQPEVAELCFHACWLQHAADELQVSAPSDPRPFFQILQWVAMSRSSDAAWTSN